MNGANVTSSGTENHISVLIKWPKSKIRVIFTDDRTKIATYGVSQPTQLKLERVMKPREGMGLEAWTGHIRALAEISPRVSSFVEAMEHAA